MVKKGGVWHTDIENGGRCNILVINRMVKTEICKPSLQKRCSNNLLEKQNSKQ